MNQGCCWHREEIHVEGFRGGGQEGPSNGTKEFIIKVIATDRQTERGQHDRPQSQDRHIAETLKRGLRLHVAEVGTVPLYIFLGMGESKGQEWGTGCMVTSAPFDITRFLVERSWHQEGTHGVSAVTVNVKGETLVRITGTAAGW